MNILYDLIHARSAKNWRAPVNTKNYELYAAHWLNCARALKEDFASEGLLDTAAEIDRIIAAQSRINGVSSVALHNHLGDQR